MKKRAFPFQQQLHSMLSKNFSFDPIFYVKDFRLSSIFQKCIIFPNLTKKEKVLVKHVKILTQLILSEVSILLINIQDMFSDFNKSCQNTTKLARRQPNLNTNHQLVDMKTKINIKVKNYGANRKVLSRGVHMCNIKTLPHDNNKIEREH